MATTKELKNVPGLDQDEIVIIKKLGFGSLNKLRNKSATAVGDMKTGGVEANLNLGDYHIYSLVYGIQEGKFFTGCRTAEDKARVIENDTLSAETGQYLFDEIQKFNNFVGVDEAKKN